jgi:hypothetical protein
VPTPRQRHIVTESDELAAALNDAAERWPEDRDSRARLLVRLAEEGHRALIAAAQRKRTQRLDAVQATSGALTGAYTPGYLDQLREDWLA